MELFLFAYLQPILCKSGLKNDFLDISKICFPMILWAFFQTSDDISRYKKFYLPNALRPTSFSYLDLYCGLERFLSSFEFGTNCEFLAKAFRNGG